MTDTGKPNRVNGAGYCEQWSVVFQRWRLRNDWSAMININNVRVIEFLDCCGSSIFAGLSFISVAVDQKKSAALVGLMFLFLETGRMGQP